MHALEACGWHVQTKKKKTESITLNIKIYSTAFLMQSPAL